MGFIQTRRRLEVARVQPFDEQAHEALVDRIAAPRLMEANEQATELLKAGFHSLKVKTGAHSGEEDVEMVRAVREAVGDNVRIFIDTNGGWEYSQALGILRKMEKYDL